MKTTNKKACDGAPTKYSRKGGEHWEQCRECKTKIVCDMINHWFFGFQNCDKKTEKKTEKATP